VNIIAVSRPRVKQTRNTARQAAPFGLGILRSLPTARFDHTAADEAWLAREDASRLDRHFDRMAVEAAALDVMTRGYHA
jgi:hypothetical protein